MVAVPRREEVTGLGTQYVRHFAGRPRELTMGSRTTPTAELGDAVVSGRPYALKARVEVDPDGPAAGLEQALACLDGRFSLLAIGSAKAVLATDLIGCGGAFVAEHPGGAVVASHLGRLAAELHTPLELDRLGTAAMLAGSIAIEGRTPFHGVRRLRACEYALIDLKSGRVERVSAYTTPAEALGLGGEARGDPGELMELIRAAVAREAGVKALLLSAGRDSQAIARALTPAHGAPVPGLTYGGWRSVDRRGAGRGARQAGIRHRRIGPLRLQLSHYADPIINVGGGVTGLQAGQHLTGARAARSHAPVVFSGFLGDCVHGSPFVTDPAEAASTLQRRNTKWVRGSAGGVQALFPAEVGAMREAIRGRLESGRGLPPGRAFQLVELTHRQATKIGATVELLHQEVEVATPFFNRDLMSYVLTRRVEDLTGSQLYRRMLAEHGYEGLGYGNSPAGRLAALVASRRGYYRTVELRAAVERSQPWLRTLLAPYRDEPVGDLAWTSLDSGHKVPLALIAAPILQTARPMP